MGEPDHQSHTETHRQSFIKGGNYQSVPKRRNIGLLKGSLGFYGGCFKLGRGVVGEH